MWRSEEGGGPCPPCPPAAAPTAPACPPPAWKHRLGDLLTIGRCAAICGADGGTDRETFGRAQAPWRRTFLALPSGLPSPATCGRGFLARVRAVAPATLPPRVAVAGTTRRGAHDRPHGQAPLPLGSAWAAASGRVLAPVAGADQAHELTASPLVLRLLELAGGLVTSDAPGGQRAIAAPRVAPGGAAGLAVQAHQPTRHEAVRGPVAPARAEGFAGYAPTDDD